ncbi:MAG: porin [Rubricoccaceae bacterium]
MQRPFRPLCLAVVLGLGPALAGAQSLPHTLGVAASGVVQTDYRLYKGAGASKGTNGFVMRRVRIEFEAEMGRFRAVVEPDLGEGEVALNDGYLEADLGRGVLVRAGRMKTPIGRESLRSATALRFTERGLPTSLVPRRDLGVMAEGAWLEDRLEAAFGVFNGVLGGDDDKGGDLSDAQDFAVRVAGRPTSGLGLGLGAVLGSERGVPREPRTPVLETPGDRDALAFRDSVVADGVRLRIAPELEFYRGPFAFTGEYAFARQRVTDLRAPGMAGFIDQSAWQVSAVVSLTGEAQHAGALRPRRSVEEGGLGALEFAARAHGLDTEGDAYPAFAGADQVARARAWGLSALWTPAPGVRLSASYDRTLLTAFDGEALTPEDFVSVRGQIVF